MAASWTRRAEQIVILVVVLTSAILRFGLATLNDEANDDHLPVIGFILANHRLPLAGDCWECFQPKLWHGTVAGISQVLQIETEADQRVLAQMVNVVASLLTLALLWMLLARLEVGPTARVMTFSLFALNPKWIGISAQATNDSFVILFSTLCLFFAQAFFSKGSARDLAGMTLGAILAALSKGNGILLPVIVVSSFALWAAREARKTPARPWAAICIPLLLFVVLQLATVPFLGQYWRHSRLYGTPFVTNFPVQAPPAPFEESVARRPGITSIARGYFTFRFADLLNEPRLNHEKFDFPMHRTSLWSQIYGRSHSLHFDYWPKSWQSRLSATDWITRAIFVLALVPTLFMLVALARSLVDEVRRTLGQTVEPLGGGSAVLVIAVLGFLAFVVLYSARYRDYSTMKAIFMFPALAGLFFLQARGLQWFEEASAAQLGLRRAVHAMIATLVVLYITDVSILVYELATP